MRDRLQDYFCGKIRLKIRNDPTKKVVQEAIRQGMLVAQLQEMEDGTYSLAISMSSWKSLRGILRSNHAKFHVEMRYGFIFWWKKIIRRPFLLVGFIVFVIGLSVASQFVWKIEVQGLPETKTVTDILNKMGISPGSWWYHVVDQEALSLALLDAIPEAAYIGVRRQGTVMIIHIVQRVMPDKVIQEVPQDIVAKAQGVIAYALVRSGQVNVHRGQYVVKGQVLVKGQLEDGRRVVAKGQVFAYVWYLSTISLPVRQRIDLVTGKKTQQYDLAIGEIPIRLWGFSKPIASNQEVDEQEKVFSFLGHVLPFALLQKTIVEVKPTVITYDTAHLLTTARRLTNENIREIAGNEVKFVKQKVLQTKLLHGKLYVRIWSEVLEDVSLPRPIS